MVWQNSSIFISALQKPGNQAAFFQKLSFMLPQGLCVK
jgi:hypothetical protein